jgi:hypothetical protein
MKHKSIRSLKYVAPAVAAILISVLMLTQSASFAMPDTQADAGDAFISQDEIAMEDQLGESMIDMEDATAADAEDNPGEAETVPPDLPVPADTVSMPSELSFDFALAFTSDKVDAELAAYARMADGGFVVTGRGRGATVARFDASGRLLYTRLFQGGGESAFYSTFYKVVATRDGGYLACGNTSCYSGGDFDKAGIRGVEGDGTALFVKFDANGTVLWARTGAAVRAHNVSGYAAGSVYETPDGKLIGMVETYALDSFATSYYRFCWDANGNPLTANEFEYLPMPVEYVTDMRVREDGGVIAVGGRTGKTPGKAYTGLTGAFFSVNADGSLAFIREYPQIHFEGLLQTGDGQYILNGMFSRHTTTADLKRAGVMPSPSYKEKQDSGVIFIRLTADGEWVGSDMILGADTEENGHSRYLTLLDDGEALYDVFGMGKLADPFSGKIRTQDGVDLCRIGKDGKLAQAYAPKSGLLTGSYGGLEGIIRLEDGSMLAVCLENRNPGYIRVLTIN